MPTQDTTSDVVVTVTSDGTARVSAGGTDHHLRAGDVEAAHRASVTHIATTLAGPAGAPVLVTVHSPRGRQRVLVHPDGTLDPAPPSPAQDEDQALRPVGLQQDDTGDPQQDHHVVPAARTPAEVPPPAPDTTADAPAAAAAASPTPAAPARESRHARPSAADLLEDTGQDHAPARAREGWRGALVRSLRLPLAPGPDEVALHADLRAAQAQLAGPVTVLVANPKGGVGKTTTTLGLAAALGVARGGGVLAWDNNETRGTMALRSVDAGHGGDVRTLLAAAPQLTSTAGRLGDLDAHVHHQPGVRFDVLPSEADPTGTGIVDGDDFTALHALLTRFYRVVLVDTGNNIRSANWRAAADVTDQLVITTTVREDSATSAAWMLDALADGPHAHLLSTAVTLLHDPAPKTSDKLRRRLVDHFAAATDDSDGTRVVRMPYEPSLAAGGRIDHEVLSRPGQRAWLHAAAAVVSATAGRLG